MTAPRSRRIAVFDNGEPYSDHAIYFVDVSVIMGKPADIEARYALAREGVRATRGWSPTHLNCTLLGVLDEPVFGWWEGDLLTWADFIKP